MEQEYTLTVFCENETGLMARIANIITRRHINIESFTASKSSIDGIYRFTIMVTMTEEGVRKLSAQIERQVDVLKTFYYLNDEIIYQEIALYKVPAKSFFRGDTVEKLVRKFNARILNIESDFIVIEKTGHQNAIEELYEELIKVGGVYEFVRSGRVAVTKPMERLNKYLKSLEEVQTN